MRTGALASCRCADDHRARGQRRRLGDPWPCVHEFLSVVTHQRISRPPMTMADALRAIDPLLGAPTLSLLGEDAGFWPVLRELLEEGRITGPKVHDARIA